ncbi:MAG: hypothetical protein JW929_14650 [Anaerolineales bacterium]|nr:hypothetical protein [Anaerolineales bacterium]
MRYKRAVLGLGLAGLLLSAFGSPPAPRPDPNARIIMQFLTVVNADGTAEFHYIFKYGKALLEDIKEAGKVPLDDICEETFAEIEDPDFTFTQENHGEEIWCTNMQEFDTLPDLVDMLEDDFGNLSVRRLEIENHTFFLDLSWSRFPCTSSDPSDFTCEWTVEAPGKVGENNATRVEEDRLTWDLMDSDTPRKFQAESAAGGSDTTLWIVLAAVLTCGCCTVLLLIIGGVAAYLIWSRRKRASEAPEDAEAAAPAPPSLPADTIKL